MILSSREGKWVINQVAAVYQLPSTAISHHFKIHDDDVPVLVDLAKRRFNLGILHVDTPLTVGKFARAVRTTRLHERVEKWLTGSILTEIYGQDGARLKHAQLAALTPKQAQKVASAAAKRFKVRLNIHPETRVTPSDLVKTIVKKLVL